MSSDPKPSLSSPASDQPDAAEVGGSELHGRPHEAHKAVKGGEGISNREAERFAQLYDRGIKDIYEV